MSRNRVEGRGLLLPSRALTWPLPSQKSPSERVFFRTIAFRSKRWRENAPPERGLVCGARPTDSTLASVSRWSCNASHRDNDLLPPHDKQSRKREVTTLEDGSQSSATHGTTGRYHDPPPSLSFDVVALMSGAQTAIVAFRSTASLRCLAGVG
ncbi:hypothetical protein BDZ89DRAFT_343787 [Hymenopellis radicata]|nr:hypothetical protein BDZ89DRAFT_343787 [Hymenopellis radicata]